MFDVWMTAFYGHAWTDPKERMISDPAHNCPECGGEYYVGMPGQGDAQPPDPEFVCFRCGYAKPPTVECSECEREFTPDDWASFDLFAMIVRQLWRLRELRIRFPATKMSDAVESASHVGRRKQQRWYCRASRGCGDHQCSQTPSEDPQRESVHRRGANYESCQYTYPSPP